MNKYLFILIFLLCQSHVFAKFKCDTTYIQKNTIVVCTSFTENNKISSISNTKNGLLDGEQIEWYSDGKIKSKSRFKNDEMIDTGYSYYHSGKLEYFNPYNGIFLRLSETGDTLSKGEMKNGKSVGVHQYWYPNHQLSGITRYNNNSEKHGLCENWREDGTRIDSTVYENGDCVEKRRYFTSGKIRDISVFKSKHLWESVAWSPDGKLTETIKNGNGKGICYNEDGKSYIVEEFKNGEQIHTPDPATVKKPIPEEKLPRISYSELCEKIVKDDTAFIKKMTKEDLEAQYDMAKITPLLIAADTGSLNCVRIMIENGANVNKANGIGDTPLSLSLEKKDYKRVLFLLKNKADPNWTEGHHTETAIYTAIETKDTALVNLLIKYGAKLDVHWDGTSPMQHAVCKGNVDVLKILLKYDDDIETPDDDGWNCMDYAKNCKNTETEKYLQELLRNRPVKKKAIK